MVASADFDPKAAQYGLSLHSSSDVVQVPGGAWLLTADFERLGDDLAIQGTGGESALVSGYFAKDDPLPLISDSGARLDGSLVETLAGPRAPMQYAQAQFAQADTSGAIGAVDAVAGTVRVSRADGSQAQLAQGDAVFLGDVIEAAGDGRVTITFVDDTTFALSSGARMTLDELVFNPGGGGVFEASVLQGTFVFLTGKIAPSGNMEVKTPVGTIGIRGTTVAGRLGIEGTESTITLLPDPDGHVGVVEVTNAAGSQVLDQANATTRIVSFFIAPSDVEILSDADLLLLFDAVLDELRRRRGGPSPDNQDQGGSTGDQDASDTADASDAQLDQAAEELGEFETAAGPLQGVQFPLTSFIAPPGAPVPEQFETPTFTTLTITGDIVLASSSFDDGGSSDPFEQPSDTRDTEEPSTPPPPASSPYTVISGGDGNDTLGGGTGQLQILGNAGDDALTGGDLDDILDGGDGNDTLDAGAGNDQVFGGAGNDLIIGGSGEGDDLLDGGGGTDTVKYSSATGDLTINLTAGTASGDPVIGSDKLVGIENVISGSGNDSIMGNGEANLLDGASGNDTIAGLAGDDTLIGGDGNDTLTGGAGNDFLDGGSNSDFDTAVFSGNLADYMIALIGGQLVLTDQRVGGDGTDILVGVDSIQFADQQLSAADLSKLANEAPTEIQLASATVAENDAGAIIGAVTVVDPDAGDTHTLTVSDARFEIVGGQLALKAGQSLDHESTPFVSFDITATDSGGLSRTQTFFISVTNVNEPPNTPSDSNGAGNQVVENAVNGTAVGLTAFATDPDAGDAVTYGLTDDAGGRFAIDAGTGIVTVASGALLDFESAASHTITVRATSSGGLFSEQSFVINVTNVNEPPAIPVDTDAAADQVAENAANGTVVGVTALAVDPDAGQIVTYSLTDSAGGRFAINATTGVVTVANGALLNFETSQSHDITVQASSSGGLTSTRTFTISIADVNEPPSTPGDNDAAPDQVAENAANGTVVGITALAIDPDVGDVVTYSLADSAGGRFTINAGTGVVTVADGALLNFESAGSHQITVRATSSGGLFSEQSFTINVTNVNEAPTITSNGGGATAAISLEENQTAVTTVTAFDPDLGDGLTFSIVGGFDGNLFSINSTTGELTTIGAPDFENPVLNGGALDQFYEVLVRATDSGGKFDEQLITVTVTDVNEAPDVPVDNNDVANQVAENAANGTLVGVTASATDPDAGDAVTYSLTDSAGGRFAIDAATGIVTVASGVLLDFENAVSHTITVRATDIGGLFSEQTFVIGVTNVNEAPSVPVDGNGAANQVAENAANGTFVGITAFSTDPDAGDAVTYSLIDDASGRFAINAVTGVVSVANGAAINLADVSYQITVQASDGNLATSQTFTITVADGDAIPVLAAKDLVVAKSGIDLVEPSELETTDAESAPNQIVYTLVALPLIGALLLNNVALGLGDTFTQQDIANGLLQYAQDGTAAATDSFVVDITDGTHTLSAQTISVAVVQSGFVADGDTGTPNVDNPLIVGDTANGRLDIVGDANVTASLGVTAGNTTDGDGQIRLDGAGATLAADGYGLVVGDTGVGALRVNNGAVVTVGPNGSNQVLIGNAASGVGHVAVDGIGSLLAAKGTGNGIQVGVNGSGVLLVGNGGRVTALKLVVGANSSGDGTATIDGSGSAVVISNDDGLFAPPDAENAGRVIVGDYGSGGLFVLNGGDLEIRAGTDSNSGTVNPVLLVGHKAGSDGAVLVAGAGSSIALSMATPQADPGDLHDLLRGPGLAVGLMGAGKMFVQDGAMVTLDGDEAFISVGVGNYLDPLDLTQYPTGELTVLSGAQVILTDTTGADGGLIVGDFQGGSGVVTVSGPGSAIIIQSQGGAAIGLEGDGALHVLAGGKVEIASDGFNNLLIGEDTTGIGTVTVSGAGSTIVTTGTDNTVQVGFRGTGNLSVGDGAVVSTLHFEVGRYGTGFATIDGAGSQVIASNDGGLFSGTDNVYAGFVRVARNAGSFGQLSITSGGILEIRPGEGINDATHSAGLEIARNLGSSGIVSVSGAGSAIVIDGDDGFLQVGRDGHGELHVFDGGVVSTLSMQIGRSGTGIVTIDGAGSKIVASNDGGVFVTSGDEVYAGFVMVGREDGSIGTLSITNGGVLEVRPGETVNQNTFGATLSIGRYAGSTGIVSVTGPGSAIVIDGDDGFLQVGRYGHGELHVANSGLVSTLTLEVARFGTGIVTIDGPGSKIVASNDGGLYPPPDEEYAGFVRVGRYYGSSGLLIITNGGVLEIRPGEGVNEGTKYAELQIARLAGSTGLVSVDGAGSAIFVEGPDNGLEVGIGGNGSLLVTNGAQVNSGFMQFGREAGAVGYGLVSGAGSAIHVTGDQTLNVGRLGSGSLTIEYGGFVTATYIHIGRGIYGGGSGYGQVIVTDANSKLIADGTYGGTLSVGRYGSGLLLVSDGGLARGSWVNVGSYGTAAGGVLVTGTGARFVSEGEMNIGRYGQGTLSVEPGGSAEANSVNIGYLYGGVGHVTVGGLGAQLITSGLDNQITVGHEGTGTLTVDGGAIVRTLNLLIAREGTGDVVIDGSGTQVLVSSQDGLNSEPYAYEAGFVRVGRQDGSAGTLTITGGAHLDIGSGITQYTDTYSPGVSVGRYAASSGHVLVSGAGSRIQITQEFLPTGPLSSYGPFINLRGQSSLTVESQGQVVLDGPYAWVGVGSRDGSNVQVEVRSGGSIRVDNADYSGGMAIGHIANATGSVHVTGLGSSIVLAGDGNRLTVGGDGEGSLLIDSGGLVKTVAVDIVGSLGTGSIKVDGAGSALVVSNDEGNNLDAAGNISLYGAATLEIVNGGKVEIRPGALNPDGLRASLDVNGASAPAGGTVRVAGLGSSLSIAQTAISPSGFFSGASLSLSAGAALAKIEDSGQLIIDSAGANLSIGGDAGTNARLEVLSGGTVLLDGNGRAAGMFVGGDVGSTGSVLISGAGSSITILGGAGYQGIAHVGFATEGTITVTNGGELHVEDGSGNGDAVHAWQFGRIDGGGGTIVANNVAINGVLAATSGAAAQMTIDGDLWFSGGTLEVDAAGVAPGTFDVFDVSGKVDFFNVNLIEFSFVGGYLPGLGDSFTFLHSGTAINVDLNNVQYILHNVTAGGFVFFQVTNDGSNLTFESFDDTVSSDGLLFRGSDLADTFTGTVGNDELFGRDGDDTLLGDSGSDFFVGGFGDDNLDGGPGADEFFYDAPFYQIFVATNQLVSTSGETGDLIANFDATVGTGDKFLFGSSFFQSVSALNFASIGTEYDGTNGGGAAYIVDSQNHLIYDDNGNSDGYTVLATVDLADTSPPISVGNLQTV